MSQPRREATAAEAKALASPVRLRILRACLGQERTNKEIAQALGRDPATTLHHVRTLVDTGFLAAQEERRGTRGAREIPYLATGKSWRTQTPGTSRYLLDTFLEEVSLVPAESVDATRLGLRMDESTRDEFSRRLNDLMAEFIERTRTFEARADNGSAWSVFVALHPDPNRP